MENGNDSNEPKNPNDELSRKDSVTEIDEYVKSKQQKKSREDVNQAAARIVKEATDD
jgi:hypothetical protein